MRIKETLDRKVCQAELRGSKLLVEKNGEGCCNDDA
jgi:hypothetical protein